MRVKRVGVWSLAKIFAVVYVGIGVLFGLLAAILMGAILVAGSGDSYVIGGTEILGLLLVMLIGVPLFAGLKGLVVGAVSALLFNAAASLKGGFEIDIAAES